MSKTPNQNYHHNTIRNYTAALLNLFGGAEVQYNLSNSELRTEKIPLMFSAREKYQILDELQAEQIKTGNTNIIPRGFLQLAGLSRNLERAGNKNLKINTKHTKDSLEYQYNSVPYDFEFVLSYVCRGMSEATQIIEQIVPMFNPNYHIDVLDVQNLQEPTRVPIQFGGVFFETEDYDFLSTNTVTITFNLNLNGNMYMPTKLTPRIKEYNLTLSSIIDGNEAVNKSLMEFDVDYKGEVY